MTSHYDTLGVPRDADAAAIKKAYRQKASKAHSDREGGDHTQMVAVNLAYATLSNPEKRDRYDRTGEDGPVQPLDSKAMDAIHHILMEILDQASDTEDVILLAREHLERSTAEARRRRSEISLAAEKLEKRRKRLSRKSTTGRDFLDDMLADRIAQLQRSLVLPDEAITVFTRALELLAEYSYTPDAPPPQKSAFGLLFAQQQAFDQRFDWGNRW